MSPSLRGMQLGIPTIRSGAVWSSPLSFGSALQLWLDASDTTTTFQASDGTTPATANDNPVGYWGDKSGKGNHATQATAGNRFTLKTNLQNGLPALFASSDLLAVSSLTLSSFAIFCVFKATSGTIVYEHGTNAGSTNGCYLTPSTSRTTQVYRGGVIQSQDLTAGWGLGNITRVTVFECQGPYTDMKFRVNGNNMTMTAGLNNNITASSVNTGFYIGARAGVAVPLIGHYMELFAVSPWPGLASIQQAEAYLAAKWGV